MLTFEPGSEPLEIHPTAFEDCPNLDEIYPREYAAHNAFLRGEAE
jgi:hypothetical protein